MSRNKITAKLSRIANPDYVEVQAGIPHVFITKVGYVKKDRMTKEQANEILEDLRKKNEAQDRENEIMELQTKLDTPRLDSGGCLRHL
jgi:uncharacterized membrane-anchored protein